MTRGLLVVHMRFPEGAGEALDRGWFARALPQDRRALLNDPMHALRARYPEELDPLPPEIRLVSGALPFGYMDRPGRRAVHVGVLSDPERAVLRFAARLARAGEAEALRLAGEGAEALTPDDPDRLVLQLLKLPRARARCAGAMTRLCAGLPLQAAGPDADKQLRAALANLRRINFLAAEEAGLDGFARYLSGVFGWPAPEGLVSARLTPPLTEPDALGSRARAALREATDLDRRLLELRGESTGDRVA